MGSTTFSGPVTSTGGFIGPMSSTDGTFSGTLAVTGESTLTGNTTVGGTLGVTGLTTLTGGLTVGAAPFNIVAATSIVLPAGTAAGTPANFAASRYITVTDGSTTRYIPLANAIW